MADYEGPENKPWEPDEADKKRFRDEYLKEQHMQSEPKKPGVLGRIGGAAVGAAKAGWEREKELRSEKTKVSERKYLDAKLEAAKNTYQFGRQGSETGVDAFKRTDDYKKASSLQREQEIGHGYEMPISGQLRMKQGFSKGSVRESEVRSKAEAMGISPMEEVITKDILGGKPTVTLRNKSISELEIETARAKQQSQDIKDFERTEQARRYSGPIRAMGSAAVQAANAVDRLGRSPMSQAMGQRRGGVTPMGVRAPNMFAPPRTQGIKLGPSMHIGTGLGNLRMPMGRPTGPGMRPMPITPKPVSMGRMPSVMPQMPKMNIGAGMGLNQRSQKKINLFPNSAAPRMTGNVPKLRLF